jgi:hypothetical protein
VCIVLRASADKGQWLLIEILNNLARETLAITVLYAEAYQILVNKYPKVQWIPLPIDQYSLAKLLRRVKVFVDCSLHEGFGLMPLEAALCGCSVVAADSGGIRDFASEFDIDLIASSPDPHNHLQAIHRRLSDRGTLGLATKSTECSGQSWIDYISPLTSKLNPILISEHPSSHFPRTQSWKSKSASYGYKWMKRAYDFLRPIIPNRIHLALKLIIKGHG